MTGRHRHFISAEKLAVTLDQVTLVDCDLEPAYNRFHLPGARLAPCRYWKGDGGDEGVFGLRDSRRFAELVQDLGIIQERSLVAYDHSGGLNAARFGWTLDPFPALLSESRSLGCR